MILVVMLLGAAIGGCVIVLVRLAAPPAPNVAVQVRRWEHARARSTRKATGDAPDRGGVIERVARWLIETIRTRRGADFASFERDCAITGITVEAWVAKALGLALIAAVGVPAVATLLRTVGIGLPMLLGPIGGLVLAAVTVLLSLGELRSSAATRREHWRRASAIYGDLVAMSMEAGRAHTEALPAAAATCAGSEFSQMQHAITSARFSGVTTWEALGQLGDRYGLPDLVELRSSLTLAHEDGAKIRSSLIARAKTLRDGRIADAEARAEKQTDSMSHTVVMMAILIVAYELTPQLMRLITG